MSQTAAMRKILANSYAASGTHGACYTTAPGGTAGTEVTGGTYARKSLTWSAPSTNGATEVITATAVFDIPAGVTVAGAGVHSAITAGTYYDGATVTSQAFSTAGTYTVTFTATIS